MSDRKYVETIVTPEMARNLLKANKMNRILRGGRVEQYAKDMRNGNWQFNGEGIMFHKDGTLANGQHRLSAVVMADVPVEMLFVYGVENDVTLFDRGLPRKTIDTLRMEGFDKKINNPVFVSMTKMHFYEQRKENNISDPEVKEFLLRNQSILIQMSDLHLGSRAKTQISVSNAGIVLAIFYALNSYHVTYKQIEDFVRILKTGIPDNANQTPPLVLRNDLANRSFRHLYLYVVRQRRAMMYATEKAICDFSCEYRRIKPYTKVTEGYYSKMECNINA